MASEFLAIILCWTVDEQSQTKAILWDLRNDKKITVNHESKTGKACWRRNCLTIFPSSETFCIHEIGFLKIDNNQVFSGIRLTSQPQKFHFAYYKYDNTLNKPICSASIIIPPEMVNLRFRAVKVNQSSKLALISQYSHPEYVEIFIHEIDESGSGHWKIHKFFANFNKNQEFRTVRIMDLWEIEKDIIFINLTGYSE